MRKPNNVLLTMGSAMLIFSGAAMAGPPMAYGQFNANASGVITSTGTGGCPAAATSCGAAVTGNGFFQRSVVIGGVTYFQTIILPENTAVSGSALSTVPFADENFVRQGVAPTCSTDPTTCGGIADSQHLYELGSLSNPGDVSAATTINAGWARGTGDVVSLNQSVIDAAAGFNVGFTMTGDGTNSTSLSVTQDISLNTDGTHPNDKQKFDLRQLTASSAGTLSPLLPTGSTNGGTISWQAQQIINAVWMGQAVTTSGTDQQFSRYQGYSNVTTGADTAYTDQTAAAPINYDTAIFGAAPTFP